MKNESRHGAVAAPSERSTETVASHLLRALPELRPSERKVARVLLADYPSAGLGTAAALAEAASVSAPTVLRLSAALGFGGFSELQSVLRAELTAQARSPFARSQGQAGPVGSLSQQFLVGARAIAAEVESSLAALPESELQATVGLLSNLGRRVFLSGGYFSLALAQSLAGSLEQLRAGVQLLPDPLGRDRGRFIEINRRDIFVLFDFARYERSSISAAAEAKRRGASVILITDPQLSPAAASADVVLPVSVESSSAFDSMVAGTVLIELLTVPVLASLGAKGRERLQLWEESHSKGVLP